MGAVDFMAQPADTTVPEAPEAVTVVERQVTQDEFHQAAEQWGGFVHYADGAYRMRAGAEVLVLDLQLVNA